MGLRKYANGYGHRVYGSFSTKRDRNFVYLPLWAQGQPVHYRFPSCNRHVVGGRSSLLNPTGLGPTELVAALVEDLSHPTIDRSPRSVVLWPHYPRHRDDHLAKK